MKLTNHQIVVLLISLGFTGASIYIGTKFLEHIQSNPTPLSYILISLGLQLMTLGLGFKYFFEAFKEAGK